MLGYRAPALIGQALSAAAPGRRFDLALDIGCGTGLMGLALRARVGHLTGVDLAPAMIAKAQERGAYDALIVGDATALLTLGSPAFDLVVAADLLAYIGDLVPLFDAVAAALTVDGVLAFSLETVDGEGFALGGSMRFAHSRAYVEATARELTLSPLLVLSASIRREAGRDAPGLDLRVRAEGAAGRGVSTRPSEQAPRIRWRVGRLTPMDPPSYPRVWRPVSHSAMAGAIGFALGGRQPTKGELPAPGISEGPATGEFADLFETDSLHLSNFGLAMRPRSLVWRMNQSGAPFLADARKPGNRRPFRPTRAPGYAVRRATAAAGEFDPDPVRFADDRISGRHPERCSDEARTPSFESELFEILNSIGCPLHLHGSNSSIAASARSH